MSRFFLTIAFFIFSIPTLVAQNYRIAFNCTYGGYSLTDMKSFQQELYEDARENLELPFDILYDFPAYLGYELHGTLSYEKSEFGIHLASRSTGGRISYGDYSGTYNVDSNLNGLEVAGLIGYKLNQSDASDVGIRANLGVSFNSFDLASNIQLSEQPTNTDNLEFSSINALIGISMYFRVYFFKNVFLDAHLGYDLHIPGNLKLSTNKDYFLTFNDGDEVVMDWSGIRAGLGIGIRIQQ